MRPYEFKDDVHMTIAYEFDVNLYRIDRETYNTLDWLGDIGGLGEALMIIIGFFYTLYHYKAFENYLVTQLFKTHSMEGAIKSEKEKYLDDKKLLDPSKLNCLF